MIILAILIARNSPATGYEPSIYASTPFLVWVYLFFSVACGIGIVIYCAYKGERSNLWVFGLVLIGLCNVVVLSLYIIRDYTLWAMAGDPGSQLGKIQETIITGHIDIVYPITHVYFTLASQLTSIDPFLLSKWTPLSFLYYL